MYPLGSLTADLQSASRRLLDAFGCHIVRQPANAERRECATGAESIGRLTHMKSLTDIPRLEVI